MSHPAYRVERRVDAPPDAVLAAIGEATRKIATTNIPPHLRRTTITGVHGRVRGPRFRVRFKQWVDGDVTEMVGHVVPAEGGGSLVQASVFDDRGAPAASLIVIGIAIVVAFAGGKEAVWIAGMGMLIGVVAWVRRAMSAINHHEAQFLVDWLNGVLDRLP